MQIESVGVQSNSLQKALSPDWIVARSGCHSKSLRNWFVLTNEATSESISVEYDYIQQCFLGPFPVTEF
jgi:hypothetical protein